MRLPNLLIVSAALVCLALSSCVESDNPISLLEGAQPDPQLYGIWRANDFLNQASDELNYYCVSKYPEREDMPRGLMKLVCIDEKNGQVEADEEPAFVTRIGNTSYLQVINTSDATCYKHGKSKVRSYTLFKYRVEADTCEVFGCDEEFLEEQIKQKHIQGQTSNLGSRLTDSTDNLRKWLVHNDAKIFKASGIVLTRMPMKSSTALQQRQ